MPPFRFYEANINFSGGLAIYKYKYMLHNFCENFPLFACGQITAVIACEMFL